MSEQRQALLTQLGFRFGLNGPHAARTMMLDDLRLLLAHTAGDAERADYVSAVVEANVLGKATRKARELALRHLATLYALDTANPIFRALRRLWALNEAAQPLLALAVALARDPLLQCEGFLGRLKTEMFFLRDLLSTTIEEFAAALDAYIRWYHGVRNKCSLGFRSPIERNRRLGIAV